MNNLKLVVIERRLHIQDDLIFNNLFVDLFWSEHISGSFVSICKCCMRISVVCMFEKKCDLISTFTRQLSHALEYICQITLL
jgi:hypothetical protein